MGTLFNKGFLNGNRGIWSAADLWGGCAEGDVSPRWGVASPNTVCAAASALWALAAAVRLRPPAGRAQPSPLRIKKALASKGHNYNQGLIGEGTVKILADLLSLLPVPGVIVRSSANVFTGARTRLSTILAWSMGYPLRRGFPQPSQAHPTIPYLRSPALHCSLHHQVSVFALPVAALLLRSPHFLDNF